VNKIDHMCTLFDVCEEESVFLIQKPFTSGLSPLSSVQLKHNVAEAGFASILRLQGLCNEFTLQDCLGSVTLSYWAL